MRALIIAPVGCPILCFDGERGEKPQEAQNAQNSLCLLRFLWFLPHFLTAEINRFLIDEELESRSSVLRQARTGLFHAAEGHGGFFVTRMNVHVGEARFDVLDVLLRIAEILCED